MGKCVAMLKKGFRLRTKEEFEGVFRRGTPLFFGALACKVAKNTQGHIRLGFSFSKKHIGVAVSRNQLRRFIVACFSEKEHAIPVDVVFFMTKKIEKGQIKTFASQAQSVVEYIHTNQ